MRVTICNKMKDIVTINNETWILKAKPTEYTSMKEIVSQHSSKLSSITSLYLSAYMSLLDGHSMYDGVGYTRKLKDDIDIVTEYERVLNKTSKLSKWERNQVKHTFERLYERK